LEVQHLEISCRANDQSGNTQRRYTGSSSTGNTRVCVYTQQP
jgi:hypothetical protein